MDDDAVIILDPVNLNVIKESLAKGGKNYIGGNCTVSLMLMGLGGLFQNDLVEWIIVHDLSGGLRRRRAEHARTARADGRASTSSVKPTCWTIRPRPFSTSTARWPRRSVRDAFPTKNFGDRRWPVRLIPWIDVPVDNGQSQGRVEGRRREQQDPRPSGLPQRRARSRSTACACASAPCAATARR